MKTAGHDVIVEGATPVSQVIVYLEQLVAALKTGAVHVRHRDDEVVLGPRDVVELAVHAKARAKRHKLSLELTWRRKNRGAVDDLELGFAADRSNPSEPSEPVTEPVTEPSEPSEPTPA